MTKDFMSRKRIFKKNKPNAHLNFLKNEMFRTLSRGKTKSFTFNKFLMISDIYI